MNTFFIISVNYFRVKNNISMRTNPFSYILIGLFCAVMVQAQERLYAIKGIVTDAFSGQPISYANVAIWNSTRGAVTDSVGRFEITEVQPGTYRLQSSFIGYKSFVTAEFHSSRPSFRLPTRISLSRSSWRSRAKASRR